MAQTVTITLVIAGLDTGPFDLYSDTDGYVTPFEIGVLKALLVAGYTSVLVPDAATIIRVASLGVCTNFVDLPIDVVPSSTTTTTTTAFVCSNCRNWEYSGPSIPGAGDVIHYYSCVDGSPQTTVLSFGDPTGSICNCNSVGNPYSDNGTILTEIGSC